MGKNAVRGKRRDQQSVMSEGVANMVVMDEYRQRTGQKKTTINYTRRVTALNDRQGDFIASIETSRIAFGVGEAGTGKTHIAVCKALEMLARGLVKKIFIARPAVEAGEKLGFQPGDADQKLHPYLIPIFDILEEELGVQMVKTLRDAKIIEIVPLAFMRGRTLKNAAVIYDEAQNMTYSQFVMALTRLGKNSKCIITGDPKQHDLKAGQSGLLAVCEKLKPAPGVDIVFFRKEDVVRDEIVETVLEYL